MKPSSISIVALTGILMLSSCGDDSAKRRQQEIRQVDSELRNVRAQRDANDTSGLMGIATTAVGAYNGDAQTTAGGVGQVNDAMNRSDDLQQKEADLRFRRMLLEMGTKK